MLDNARNPVHRGDDRHHTMGRRLEYDEGESLVSARKDQDVRRIQERADVVVVASKRDAVADTFRVSDRRAFRLWPVANDNEHRVRILCNCSDYECQPLSTPIPTNEDRPERPVGRRAAEVALRKRDAVGVTVMASPG